MTTLGRTLCRWTYSEIAELQRLYAAGKNRAQMCEALRKTDNQVRSRLQWEHKKTNGISSARKHSVPNWTPKEIEIGRELVARRASNEECLAAVGRTFHACYVKLERGPHGARRRSTPQPLVPPEIMEAASARLYAPRPLTAWVFGDPAPGHSALDRRESRA